MKKTLKKLKQIRLYFINNHEGGSSQKTKEFYEAD